MWIAVAIGVGLIVLAHTAPAPFLLEALAGDRAVWHMPRTAPPTIYLTYDDGPNPATTPRLLDVLARERAHATFFVIDAHVTAETAPIIRRMFDEGHGVGIHTASRADMLWTPAGMAAHLEDAAGRIASLAGRRPCRLFRPHAGWRTSAMYAGLSRLDYRLAGWGWMLWDFNWYRPRTAASIVNRLAGRLRGGDIVVMHDGDEKAPRKDQPQTVDATAQLIPLLRERGFHFDTLCASQP